MKKLTTLVFFLSLFASNLFSQDFSDKTLMRINGEEVKVSEFVKVYEKNLDLVQDPEQKKLDNYMPLFISYKAKLMQAREMGLDTVQAYIDELDGYRKDLAAPYFKDPQEEEKLLKEAWERSKYDLKVSHILLMLEEDAPENKASQVYQKINNIREEIVSGKISFSDAAVKYSEGPSAKNGGALNWMNVFYMVYPFETGAYNTEKGKVSQAVRTRFGYHLIFVEDKVKSKGNVQIAHIVKVNRPGEENDSINAANAVLMDSIYTKLQRGGDFAELARQNSDDMRSRMNGGAIPPVGRGKLIPEMEKYAFSLNEGEFSRPFQTQYGWHIIKVLSQYPVKTFEESEEELKQKLQRDNRSQYIEKSVVDHLYKKYEVKLNQKNFDYIESKIDDSFLKPGWSMQANVEDRILFSLENKDITVSKYVKYLEENPVSPKNKYSLDYVLKLKRGEFTDAELLKYYDEHLEDEYDSFKDVMENYREGILIYNLMDKKIWERSRIDSTGLENYYQENKSDYMWPERADLIIAKCFDKKDAEKLRKYLKRGKDEQYIKEKMNTDNNVRVIFQNGLVSEDNSSLPEGFEWKKGVSDIYMQGDKNYVVVFVKEFVDPQVKSFEEAQTKLRSDYQTYLENEWNKELMENYQVNIDKEVYTELKAGYGQ